MPAWNLYVELMGDPPFAILTAFCALGLFLFFILLLKWVRAGSSAASKGAAGVIYTMETPPPAPAPAAKPASPAPAKPTPAAPPPSATPPPPPSAAPSAKSPDLAKTVVLPPRETPPAPSVDMGMYEALVRRIATVESEVKKDPLFLDPLLKRVSQIEKREPAPAPAADNGAMTEKINAVIAQLNALVQQVAALEQKMQTLASTPPPASPTTAGGVSPDEFHAFKEKVYGLQKILEHLAEAPPPS